MNMSEYIDNKNKIESEEIYAGEQSFPSCKKNFNAMSDDEFYFEHRMFLKSISIEQFEQWLRELNIVKDLEN